MSDDELLKPLHEMTGRKTPRHVVPDDRRIISVAGALRSGKSTIAAYLIRVHGFTSLAWADQLRGEMSRVVFRRTLKQIIRDYDQERVYGEWSLEVDFDEAWWDRRLDRAMAEKKPACLRPFLQEFGTEDRRMKIDDQYWLDAWRAASLSYPRTTRFVIPDTRFRNEAKRVREMGGLLINVTRHGYTGDNHKSERDLDEWTDWDLIVKNDGSIEELEHTVGQWLLTQ